MAAVSVLVATGVVDVRAVAAQALKLPDGVTAKMVDEGRQLFKGAGNCFTCHGESAEGTPIAPNLTDETWLHVDGESEGVRRHAV